MADGALAVDDAVDVLARLLARDLDEAEARDVDDVRLRAVVFDLLAHVGEQLFLLRLLLHVDEVDDDDAADVAQANLLEDLGSGLEVRLVDSVAEIRLADVLARVDVNDGQGFCLIDDEEAARFGLRYNRVYIKDVKSRWGSCSSLGNINLSLWLMLAPIDLVYYVVYHELAHLNEMNHSARFWAQLDAFYGEPGRGKFLESKMKAFALDLQRRYMP